jgi:signal transduction histidine kinase
MHSLLARQLKRSVDPGAAPADSKPFLEAIDRTYRQFDDDRAMLERSLEVCSQELLAANSELLATIESSRLLQAKVLRAEGTSAAGQTAARVAQELRAPLDLILQLAQAIGRRTAPDDPDAGAIRHIEREAIRCQTIVEALLSYENA